MAQKDVHPNARPLALERSGGKTAFFLVHGYTGSPTDFNGLPYFLSEKYGASVFVPLLPGHGTRVEDLHALTKDDFIKFTERELQPILSKYERVIVGGHSFGGQVALYLGANHPVHGIFVTAAPYRPAFPLSIPGFYELWNLISRKEFLKKRLSKEQIKARAAANSFSYNSMPAYGLKLILEINKDLRNLLSKITSPLLSFYVRGDWIAHVGSGEAIEMKINSVQKRIHIFDSLEHGVFFTRDAEQIYKEIADFFKL